MGITFKKNSINLVISTLIVLCTYHIGLGGVFFWFGGLLLIPAIAIWFQFKFALGNFMLRLSIAVLPWLALCLMGLIWASKTKYDGQRTMNMFFFEMPLYSVLASAVVVFAWHLNKKGKKQG